MKLVRSELLSVASSLKVWLPAATVKLALL